MTTTIEPNYRATAAREEAEARIKRELENAGLLPSDVGACLKFIRRRLDQRGVTQSSTHSPFWAINDPS